MGHMTVAAYINVDTVVDIFKRIERSRNRGDRDEGFIGKATPGIGIRPSAWKEA
jgi:hypothetical protein